MFFYFQNQLRFNLNRVLLKISRISLKKGHKNTLGFFITKNRWVTFTRGGSLAAGTASASVALQASLQGSSARAVPAGVSRQRSSHLLSHKRTHLIALMCFYLPSCHRQH